MSDGEAICWAMYSPKSNTLVGVEWGDKFAELPELAQAMILKDLFFALGLAYVMTADKLRVPGGQSSH